MRCVMNMYSTRQFWRAWHRSFNQWIVRYMYIPLGGRRFQLLSVILIFNFVAVWHEVEFQLLFWAWANSALFFIEAALEWAFSGNRFLRFRFSRYFRPLCVITGVWGLWLQVDLPTSRAPCSCAGVGEWHMAFVRGVVSELSCSGLPTAPGSSGACDNRATKGRKVHECSRTKRYVASHDVPKAQSSGHTLIAH